ncbi:DUF5954 family protein [Streptomyces sp. NPDC090025]|uniref:DUF5954 family protein n=1 Tax=Streptomyces sp. NPDC090025 TaxID=3365922 RepID=UPI00383625C0
MGDDDPVALVSEADAVQAAVRYPSLAVRGALFGIAVCGEDGVWTLVKPVREPTAQCARDSLNSLLWFRAKDDTDDPAERRELLAAVDVLERETVNEVRVLGERFRVVRGDEVARSGPEGLEPPRPTDVEPLDPNWDKRRPQPTPPDEGFTLDPARKLGRVAESLRSSLREFSYFGARYPAEVRDESTDALLSHPDVVLLPTTFGIVEKSGARWEPQGSIMPTPHEARAFLCDVLTELWPMMYEFDDERRARYQRAADEFRARGRSNELTLEGRLFRVFRAERMVRFGPDGPEPPRSTDVDQYGPMKLHPTMDENGVIHHEADPAGE